MRRFIIFSALAFFFMAGSLQAQVRVQVNGDRTFTINQTNGLYFSNDTMRVDDAVYALDDIQVITLTPVTQRISLANEEAFQLTPNPAREAVTLNGIGSAPQTVTLYNTAGMQLMQQTATDGTVLNISHLPEGLYLLQCGNRVAKLVIHQ